MLRAVLLAARLQSPSMNPSSSAITRARTRFARQRAGASGRGVLQDPPLGHAEEAFRQLRSTGLLKGDHAGIAAAPDPSGDDGGPGPVPRPVRRRPESLTNAILAGTLLFPLGLASRHQRFSADPLERRVELDCCRSPAGRGAAAAVLSVQSRLLDIQAPIRAQRGLLTPRRVSKKR